MFRHSSPHPALRATLSRSTLVQITNGGSGEIHCSRGSGTSHPFRGAVLSRSVKNPGWLAIARSPRANIPSRLRRAETQPVRAARKLAWSGAERHSGLCSLARAHPERGARQLGQHCSGRGRLPEGEGLARSVSPSWIAAFEEEG